MVHPEHGTVNAGSDGLFEVSPELAGELLRQPAWATEEEHVADAGTVSLRDLYNPATLADALTALRLEVATLRAGGSLPEEEPRPTLWQPDTRTLGWVCLHLLQDAAGLDEWTRLVVESDVLQRAAAAPSSKAAK